MPPPHSLWIYELNFAEKKGLVQAEANTNLTLLSLSSNRISDSGAKALCQVLPNTHIVSFDLSDNPINDSGWVYCASSATTDMPQLFQLLRRSYHRLSRLFSSFSIARELPFKFDDAETAQARSGVDVFGNQRSLASFNFFAAFEVSSADFVSDA